MNCLRGLGISSAFVRATSHGAAVALRSSGEDQIRETPQEPFKRSPRTEGELKAPGRSRSVNRNCWNRHGYASREEITAALFGDFLIARFRNQAITRGRACERSRDFTPFDFDDRPAAT